MPAQYATGNDVRALLVDTPWNDDYDALLDTLCLRVSRAIDRYTGRSPESYAAPSVTHYYDGSGRREQWVNEFVGTPTVSMNLTGSFTDSDYQALDPALDFIAYPYNAAAESLPYTRLDLDIYRSHFVFWYPARRAVKVTANFGYSLTPPDEIVQATITQAMVWFKRAQQGYQRVAGTQGGGQDVYDGGLDPDVCLTLKHFTSYAV